MPLTIEVEQEEDGRWLAEVPELPGVLTYGQTRQAAIERAQALSLRVLADRRAHGEPVPQMNSVFAVTPCASGPQGRPGGSWLPCFGSAGASSDLLSGKVVPMSSTAPPCRTITVIAL